MTSLELFAMIKEVSTNSKDFVVHINDMIILSDGSKLSKELNQLLEEYCNAHNICSCCGETLFEDEEVDFKICKNCG